MKLEPTYEGLPSGFTNLLYIPGKNHQVTGPQRMLRLSKDAHWEAGDRYISRVQEFVQLKQMLADANPDKDNDQVLESELRKVQPYDVARKKEYPSIEEMVVALWEYQNGDTREFNRLNALRESVRTKYPKGR